MRWYSGIDLHSNNNLVAVIDGADRVVYRRRLPNRLLKNPPNDHRDGMS